MCALTLLLLSVPPCWKVHTNADAVADAAEADNGAAVRHLAGPALKIDAPPAARDRPGAVQQRAPGLEGHAVMRDAGDRAVVGYGGCGAGRQDPVRCARDERITEVEDCAARHIVHTVGGGADDAAGVPKHAEMGGAAIKVNATLSTSNVRTIGEGADLACKRARRAELHAGSVVLLMKASPVRSSMCAPARKTPG